MQSLTKCADIWLRMGSIEVETGRSEYSAPNGSRTAGSAGQIYDLLEDTLLHKKPHTFPARIFIWMLRRDSLL